MIVYKVTNRLNGKVYVGQTTKTLEQRIKEHLCRTVNQSTIFQNALRKYGINNFNMKVIDHGEDRDDLNNKEQFWIKFFNCIAPKGYNITSGGDANPVCHPLVRQKISIAQTGKKRSEQTKIKISEYFKGRFVGELNSMYGRCGSESATFGRKHTEEEKQKMKDNHKDFTGENHPKFGKKWSEESRKKLSKSRTGIKISEEARLNMNKNRIGKKHSEETKAKMSAKSKGRPSINKGKQLSEEVKIKMSIAMKEVWAKRRERENIGKDQTQ